MPPANYDALINTAAQKYGLDPGLLRRLIQRESAGNPLAVSRRGARGLMQLMPETAGQLGVQNAFDPEQNVMGGSRYLSEMLRRFNGDTRLALAAYNAGPGAVERFKGVPPYPETQAYVQHILGDDPNEGWEDASEPAASGANDDGWETIDESTPPATAPSTAPPRATASEPGFMALTAPLTDLGRGAVEGLRNVGVGAARVGDALGEVIGVSPYEPELHRRAREEVNPPPNIAGRAGAFIGENIPAVASMGAAPARFGARMATDTAMAGLLGEASDPGAGDESLRYGTLGSVIGRFLTARAPRMAEKGHRAAVRVLSAGDNPEVIREASDAAPYLFDEGIISTTNPFRNRTNDLLKRTMQRSGERNAQLDDAYTRLGGEPVDMTATLADLRDRMDKLKINGVVPRSQAAKHKALKEQYDELIGISDASNVGTLPLSDVRRHTANLNENKYAGGGALVATRSQAARTQAEMRSANDLSRTAGEQYPEIAPLKDSVHNLAQIEKFLSDKSLREMAGGSAQNYANIRGGATLGRTMSLGQAASLPVASAILNSTSFQALNATTRLVVARMLASGNVEGAMRLMSRAQLSSGGLYGSLGDGSR